nr:hypothetical protein [Sphingomonas guangdongensis]
MSIRCPVPCRSRWNSAEDGGERTVPGRHIEHPETGIARVRLLAQILRGKPAGGLRRPFHRRQIAQRTGQPEA